MSNDQREITNHVYWKAVETFQDIRIGHRAKVKLGIDNSSIREGEITSITKRHVIIELDNKQGEVQINKTMLPAIQFLYDLEAEKEYNKKQEASKLLSKSPSYIFTVPENEDEF